MDRDEVVLYPEVENEGPMIRFWIIWITVPLFGTGEERSLKSEYKMHL